MKDNYENMKFEAALEKLGEIVERMENEENDFDALIRLYEDACRLVIICRRQLSEVNDKIVKLDERIAALGPEYEELLDVPFGSEEDN